MKINGCWDSESAEKPRTDVSERPLMTRLCFSCGIIPAKIVADRVQLNVSPFPGHEQTLRSANSNYSWSLMHSDRLLISVCEWEDPYHSQYCRCWSYCILDGLVVIHRELLEFASSPGCSSDKLVTVDYAHTHGLANPMRRRENRGCSPYAYY